MTSSYSPTTDRVRPPSLVYSSGVASRFMDLNRMVESFSTTPAVFLDSFLCKGPIAEGSDARMMVFGPDAETGISIKIHHLDVEYELYMGMRLKKVSEVVIANGSVLMEYGKHTAIHAAGRFLKRGIQFLSAIDSLKPNFAVALGPYTRHVH